MSTEPCYFGDRNLFGLYRPASASGTARRHLVVICNATFHEYFKTQFVARQVARELAEVGYDVMRFDYTGQGNSGGDLQDFFWPDDLRLAVEEGLAVSGAQTVSLIGLRFGALMAAAYDGPLHSIAIWDAMSSGRLFVDHLYKVHALLINQHKNMSADDREKFMLDQLVGYRVGEKMLKKLGDIESDWQDLEASRLQVITSEEKPDVRITGFRGEVFRNNEAFLCQWNSPSSRLLYAHGVIRNFVEFFG